MRSPRSTRLGLALGSFVLALACLEGGFRLAGFDFARDEQAWRRFPPYYRQPTVPLGEAFFRRPGPETWTGQVLHTVLRLNGIEHNPYADEPVITVRYDERGFRNEGGLTDWEVVVTGDSFTELGCLPFEQLFTTRLGERLGLRVANLGASYTGPLTQLAYLQAYGLAPSTRHVVVVFFEGNDLANLDREHRALTRARQTGVRELREFQRQSSLCRALVATLREAAAAAPATDVVTAHFRSARGDVPVTLTFSPPGSERLSADSRRGLEVFLAELGAFARGAGTTPWLAYMPCKLRVVHDRVEFTEAAPARLRDWQPTDLPDVVRALCEQQGVAFVDLTPALVAETAASGELVFNSIFDTHLNARGAAAVAEELARRLAAADGAEAPAGPGR